MEIYRFYKSRILYNITGIGISNTIRKDDKRLQITLRLVLDETFINLINYDIFTDINKLQKKIRGLDFLMHGFIKYFYQNINGENKLFAYINDMYAPIEDVIDTYINY